MAKWYHVTMQIKSRYTSLIISCLSLSSTIFSWDGSYEGGDIAAARRSFLSQNPIDLWGGFSGFFYGNIPSYVFPWGLWLLFIQITCATTGLILISKHVRLINKAQHLLFFILSYLILCFCGYLTRDSTMASFYILGFGLILSSSQLLKISDKVLFFFGTSFIILAVAFRPWLFFAALLPTILLGRYKIKNLVFAVILMILPLCTDKLTYFTTEYKEVHPELQVIISDVASMTCLSNNIQLRKNGTDLLNNFSKTFFSNGQICEDYRLSNWGSVGSWSLNSFESNLVTNFNGGVSRYSKILISSDMTAEKYTEIRNSWLNLLANYPKDYLQIKLIHANQIMISGDTFGLRISNAGSTKKYLAGIFFVPFDIVITLHLLSPAMTFLIGFIIIVLWLSRISIYELIRTQEVAFAYLFVFFWVLMTSIAYIGDNGRYTYLSSFIFFIFIFFRLSKTNAFSTKEQIEYKSRTRNE